MAEIGVTGDINDTSVKSKRPSDSAFKQQRLPAWQPILTAGTVLPTFFVIGIAFIPIGVGLLYFSDEIKEIEIDYTDCNSTDLIEGSIMPCALVIANATKDSCTCEIEFELPEPFLGSVFMYYGLSNYYQNHRRYVKSRDDNQLLGLLSDTPSTDCAPFQFDDKKNEKAVVPCGAIANSLFSDNLTLSMKNIIVPLIRTGIAWPSDKNIKFKNPSGNITEAFSKYAKPQNWKKNIWELDPYNENNNGFQNEDLIVWMRTAALPAFRKLYRRVNHTEEPFKKGLPNGTYVLHVDYSYSVRDFDGKKKMILSTTSILGGKNPFLGIAYIVVGCICLVLGIILLFIHVKCSKSTNELINVNPRTPYQ